MENMNKKYKKESDLFAPLKKYFKDDGFKVFPEVPCNYRSVDFVAVSVDVPEYHIAVEMKLGFTIEVVRQAIYNTINFHRSIIAVPTKIKNPYENKKFDLCRGYNIGILRVLPDGNIEEILESQWKEPRVVYDFDGFEEKENDIAGVPYQKGTSTAFVVLDRIKLYVTKNPEAEWGDIFENVQHHYSNKQSLSGSMAQWKGFYLEEFKKTLN